MIQILNNFDHMALGAYIAMLFYPSKFQHRLAVLGFGILMCGGQLFLERR